MAYSYERLKNIMRSNSIYETELLTQCGLDENKVLEHPNPRELGAIKYYFEQKYPNINFEFIMGNSSSPNNLVNIDKIKGLMNTKNISISQFNRFAKTELGKENCFYFIINGLYPNNKKEAEVIMNYLEKLIDNNGDYTYTGTTQPTTKTAEKIAKKKAKKVLLVDENPGHVKYKVDPENYVKNNLDIDRLTKIAHSQGYTQQGFQEMTYPGPNGGPFIRRLFGKKATSIPRHLLPNIEAALNVAISNSGNIRTVSKSPEFPRDSQKNFKFRGSFLRRLDTAMLRVMANNAGIAVHILIRARGGESIWFSQKCIRRMFNKDMISVLRISDLNDILLSSNGEKISNRLITKRGKSLITHEPVNNPVETAENETKKSTELTDNQISKIISDTKKVEKIAEIETESKAQIIEDLSTAPYGGDKDKKIDKKKDTEKSPTIKIPQKNNERYSNKTNYYSSLYKLEEEKPEDNKIRKEDNMDQTTTTTTLKQVVEYISKASSAELEGIIKLSSAMLEKNKVLEQFNTEFNI